MTDSPAPPPAPGFREVRPVRKRRARSSRLTQERRFPKRGWKKRGKRGPSAALLPPEGGSVSAQRLPDWEVARLDAAICGSIRRVQDAKRRSDAGKWDGSPPGTAPKRGAAARKSAARSPKRAETGPDMAFLAD